MDISTSYFWSSVNLFDPETSQYKIDHKQANKNKLLKELKRHNWVFKSETFLRMIKIPDYDHFNDVDIAYSDFIKHITLAINEIASLKEIRIEKYS